MLSSIRNCLRSIIDNSILRLYKTGHITVTVRHVTESRKCVACNSTGRIDRGDLLSGYERSVKMEGSSTSAEQLMWLQGVCLACRGSGRITQ